MSTPTAADALVFKHGRYGLDIGGELVMIVTVLCRDCHTEIAYHVEPVSFDELAEDVWRHEKVHEHG